MTDLQAAIARLTANDYLTWATKELIGTDYSANGLAFQERRRDMLIVASATLDARPITAEGLMERGFRWDEDMAEFSITLGENVLDVEYDGEKFNWWYFNDGILMNLLAPQTMGDLTTLLLRLERRVG
mgnify:FL=1